MVGIPRSGGCHNCRRLRKACDQQRPQCQRCIKAGRACEGYERYRTFVNRTATGIQKRQRLEEAIIPDALAGVTLDDRNNAKHALNVPSTEAPKSHAIHVPSKAAEDALVERFLALYLPRDEQNRGGPLQTWLLEVLALEKPPTVLRLALYALVLSRIGTATDDEKLLAKSRGFYGEALKFLKEKLSSPKAWQDDLIAAAARCLMIYELFESTTSTVQAWASHENGLVRMTVMRGPHFYSTKFSKALLTDIKIVHVITCMQWNTKPLFQDEAWRLQVTPSNIDEVEHRFIDLAFDLTTLYERHKEHALSDWLDPEIDRDLLRDISLVDSNLEQLSRMLESLRPNNIGNGDASSEQRGFWNLESAINWANVNVLRMDIAENMRQVLQRMDDHNLGELLEPPILPSEINSIREKFSEARQYQYGELVLSAVEYAVGEEMGLYGPQRTLFALRFCFHLLAADSTAYQRAGGLYKTVMTSRGVKHAASLNKVWGDLMSSAAPIDDFSEVLQFSGEDSSEASPATER